MILPQKEAVVLECLTNAASRGEMCPDNSLLACVLDCDSIATPANVIKRLESKGLIAVTRYQRARVVTIRATGQSTKEPNSTAPHWRSRKGRTRHQTVDLFAERLAEGLSVNEAASSLGVSKSYGRVMLGEIKRGLGWQAQ